MESNPAIKPPAPRHNIPPRRAAQASRVPLRFPRHAPARSRQFHNRSSAESFPQERTRTCTSEAPTTFRSPMDGANFHRETGVPAFHKGLPSAHAPTSSSSSGCKGARAIEVAELGDSAAPAGDRSSRAATARRRLLRQRRSSPRSLPRAPASHARHALAFRALLSGDCARLDRDYSPGFVGSFYPPSFSSIRIAQNDKIRRRMFPAPAPPRTRRHRPTFTKGVRHEAKH